MDHDARVQIFHFHLLPSVLLNIKCFSPVAVHVKIQFLVGIDRAPANKNVRLWSVYGRPTVVSVQQRRATINDVLVLGLHSLL